MGRAFYCFLVGKRVVIPVSYTHLDVYKRQGPGTASLERDIALNSVVNRAVSVEAWRTPKTCTAAVAVGLDAGDSTPLSVTRRGGGIKELDVGVRVAMI